MRYLLVLLLCLVAGCGRVGKLTTGKYAVADQEYSSQNYNMERRFDAAGSFQEKHVVDRCLLMEMAGRWKQEGGTLTLSYARMRTRPSCQDSLPAWGSDSAQLKIPVRNVDASSYEALLAASDGRPEKWIRWLKTE